MNLYKINKKYFIKAPNSEWAINTFLSRNWVPPHDKKIVEIQVKSDWAWIILFHKYKKNAWKI